MQRGIKGRNSLWHSCSGGCGDAERVPTAEAWRAPVGSTYAPKPSSPARSGPTRRSNLGGEQGRTSVALAGGPAGRAAPRPARGDLKNSGPMAVAQAGPVPGRPPHRPRRRGRLPRLRRAGGPACSPAAARRGTFGRRFACRGARRGAGPPQLAVVRPLRRWGVAMPSPPHSAARSSASPPSSPACRRRAARPDRPPVTPRVRPERTEGDVSAADWQDCGARGGPPHRWLRTVRGPGSARRG
jgi:hypothetical protein